MSFGRVGVIHETQFQNSAISAGLTPALADELSYLIGLKTAINHELPAVIVIENIRDQIMAKPVVNIGNQIKEEIKAVALENSNAPLSEVKESIEATEIKIESVNPKFDSYVDMSMIKLSPNGYV